VILAGVKGGRIILRPLPGHPFSKVQMDCPYGSSEAITFEIPCPDSPVARNEARKISHRTLPGGLLKNIGCWRLRCLW